MIHFKKIILSLSFLLILFVSMAQEKYSTVKIYAPSDKMKRSALIGLLQIDHFYTEGTAIISQVGEHDIEQLKQSGFKYEILVNDAAKNLQQENKKYYAARNSANNSRVALEQVGGVVNNIIATPSSFEVQPTLGGYYSYAQMITAIDNLVSAYPAIAQKFSLGKSVENRDIWCIKISDNVATDEADEPEVLYIGLQHAREAIGGSSMIFLMQYLCENYGIDSKIKDLVDHREIFIIPCMNPDGWEYNRVTNPNGGGGWRKNRKQIARGEYGVDLNRNWSVDWGNCGAPILGAVSSCGSAVKTSSNETYWGASPFSEPETQAVRAFALSHHLVAMIDQHSFGPYYSLPLGRPSLHPLQDGLTVAQQDFYTTIPALMGAYNGMRAGNSIQSVGYEVAGGVKDWMLRGEIGNGAKGIVYGMTGEGAAGGGTIGTYGDFWAPASQIIYLCKGMCYQDLQLAYSAGSYDEINDLDDIAVNSKTGSFNFQIRRIGLDDEPVTVSMIPIENIQSTGSPVTIASLPKYYDVYTGNISYNLFSSIANGQRIKYAWKLETGGYTYYDTVVKFYNPLQLLYDDMEGNFGTNWIAAINSTSIRGWGFTSSSSFDGSKSMTESTAGNYTTNSIRTATYSGGNGSFDLSDATAAYLTFWTKHRAENFRDRLQVQLSTNGTTWTPIAGTTTVQEPVTFDGTTINGQPSLTGIRDNWTKEIFDLDAFRSFSRVLLRFQFLSDGDGSGYDFELDDGFYIDNVKVIKSVASFNPLPVRFLDIYGKITPDNKIQLSWKAGADEKFKKYEVEKSTDGQSFKLLETVNELSDNTFTDADPFTGDNYYRVKGVDINGQFTYSRTIDIIHNSARASLIVYPNPAENLLYLKINLPKPATGIVQITDIPGHEVYRQNFSSNTTTQQIQVNINLWKRQMYIVKMIGANNELLSVQKFIRL